MTTNNSRFWERLSNFIVEHRWWIIFILLVFLILIYYFYPHNVYKLIFANNTISSISVVKTNDEDNTTDELILSNKQKNDLLAAFKNSYAHMNIFHKIYVNDSSIGYILLPENSNKNIYFLSPDIISIDGTQYKIYGQTLSLKVKQIIESEEKQ